MKAYQRVVFILLAALMAPGALAQDHSSHTAAQTPRPQVSPSASTGPKTRTEEPRSVVEVPPEQQERLGLKTAAAQRKQIEHSIRTVGNVTADQTKEAHVHSKINGWIDRIYADYIGKPIKKGEALFELYSPDLVSTQEEYLSARKQGGAGREISQAALERLKLWGVPQAEIDRLTRSGKSKRTISFSAPVDGFIVNKTAIQGMYITPEMELYHIADLSKIWIVVTLYEYDISAIIVGDEATIVLPYDATKSFNGKISYIYPEIDPETRTAKARIELPNPEQRLKPGMFTNVEIKKDLGEAVTIPDDAVIDTGTRAIVFLKTGASRFEPREVKVGPRVEGSFAILSGLKSGDQVVTNAHFLIDAESKLQAALQKGDAPSSGHSGHGNK